MTMTPVDNRLDRTGPDYTLTADAGDTLDWTLDTTTDLTGSGVVVTFTETFTGVVTTLDRTVTPGSVAFSFLVVDGMLRVRVGPRTWLRIKVIAE